MYTLSKKQNWHVLTLGLATVRGYNPLTPPDLLQHEIPQVVYFLNTQALMPKLTPILDRQVKGNRNRSSR